MPSVDTLNQIRTAVAEDRLLGYRYLSADGEAGRADTLRRFETLATQLQRLETAYGPMITSPEERALYEAYRAKWREMKDLWKRCMELDRTSNDSAVTMFRNELRAVYDGAVEVLEKNMALNRSGADAAVKAAFAVESRAALTTWLALGFAVICALGAMAFALLRVARPIDRMTIAMSRLAEGEAGTEVPDRQRRDEIGAMAAAVQIFKDNLIRTRRLEEETALARATAETQRKAAMREMADAFERAVGGIVGMVSSSATELQATARTMTTTASQTASRSTTVAAAAEEAATNVNTVAAAAEELGSSVQEIGRQVSGSADLARSAVTEADQAGVLVQDLSSAVARIGNVVALISNIAGQTNLLALNATIEAARAGEAGRGFAVVATEVKELASQTAKATGDIGHQIGQIQTATAQAVSAIDSITSRIREINGVAATIAAAVEEQGAATQEIVRNVTQASTGTGEVTTNIAGVAGAAEETGAAASQVLAAASELSRQSEHLGAEVARFLATVRAA